jgi:hypothetical protein
LTDIKVYRSLDKVLEIVYTLRKDGLVQGQDFDFTWVPENNYGFYNEEQYKKHVIFTFYDEELAMMFALKYGS